jgi:hypothetical protein
LAELFKNWPNFLKPLVGQQFRDLAKLVLLIIHKSRITPLAFLPSLSDPIQSSLQPFHGSRGIAKHL